MCVTYREGGTRQRPGEVGERVVIFRVRERVRLRVRGHVERVCVAPPPHLSGMTLLRPSVDSARAASIEEAAEWWPLLVRALSTADMFLPELV